MVFLGPPQHWVQGLVRELPAEHQGTFEFPLQPEPSYNCRCPKTSQTQLQGYQPDHKDAVQMSGMHLVRAEKLDEWGGAHCASAAARTFSGIGVIWSIK